MTRTALHQRLWPEEVFCILKESEGLHLNHDKPYDQNMLYEFTQSINNRRRGGMHQEINSKVIESLLRHAYRENLTHSDFVTRSRAL